MQAGADKGEGRSVRWGDVLLCAIAAVSWSLIGMAGTAALGLHLLGADSVGSLGPMTAATVALGAGGSLTPSGDVSAFGLDEAEATTAVDIAPLGVGLVGALLLAHFFLRSLRMAGVVISPAELIARAGAVIALFLAMLAGLVWAGHDVVTIDGERLGLDKEIDKGIEEGLDRLPGGIGDKLPDGLGDIGDVGDIGGIGGLLPDRLGDLAQAKASVGFTVDTAPTLLGGTVWAAGVLLIALLASRRTPLPRGLGALHRVVRPAASALVTVALVAVAAGFAAAAYAMTGDDHPRRIAGAALLGAPNGVWLGVPVGLLVPWDGSATGVLTRFLPDPVDDLLSGSSERALTLGRLAELDGRVWLLGVAAALMMLFAGVLTAVRTPVAQEASARTAGALGFAGRCGVRLGAATAVGLPLLVWLTGVSADASLSVFGIDAFGAGIELHGRVGAAALLGAAWGFGAGAAGAALAYATGAAGGRAAPLALALRPGSGSASRSGSGSESGSASGSGSGSGNPKATDEAAAGRDEAGAGAARGEAGPYRPGTPHRPPNPDTNPYLRPPPDVSSAPTVVGPIVPPPRPRPKQVRPRPRPGDWPPPPPPPPPPPKAPRGPR
ncbi:streptophobe family protein [Streptomyces sp. NPDC017988]|uniref:streptophobe family protein n=1 Tax=Streptomyces sp. NPDC017988 TaxID=3365025 RepID=UPI0037BAE591